MSRCRIQVWYEGRVQGVGFRFTTKHIAEGFEVAGTVKNLTDGRVELVAEGEKEELVAFQKAIRESGLGHFIQREDVKWPDATVGLKGFEIIR